MDASDQLCSQFLIANQQKPCQPISNWWLLWQTGTLSPQRLWGTRTFGSNIPVVPDLRYRLRAFVFEKFKRKSEKIGSRCARLEQILNAYCLWQGIWIISEKNVNISHWNQHFSKPLLDASWWVLTAINWYKMLRNHWVPLFRASVGLWER